MPFTESRVSLRCGSLLRLAVACKTISRSRLRHGGGSNGLTVQRCRSPIARCGSNVATMTLRQRGSRQPEMPSRPPARCRYGALLLFGGMNDQTDQLVRMRGRAQRCVTGADRLAGRSGS